MHLFLNIKVLVDDRHVPAQVRLSLPRPPLQGGQGAALAWSGHQCQVGPEGLDGGPRTPVICAWRWLTHTSVPLPAVPPLPSLAILPS